MMKKWYQIKIKTDNRFQELICDYLQNFPIQSIQIIDKRDIEDMANNLPEWVIIENISIPSDEYIYIETYIDQEKIIKSDINKINSKLMTYPNTSCNILNFDDKAWDCEWKKYYAPIDVGEKIKIVPAWQIIDSTDRNIIFIEPGMAFGTGQHETTVMCIELMENLLMEHNDVLDVGCGSGILSIVACKLNASKVTSVDIDSLAIESSRKNIRLNNVVDKIDLYEGNLLTENFISRSFGIVVANILSNIILDFIPLLKYYLKENGVFIASGILYSQKDSVILALEDAGFVIQKILHQGEWIAIKAMKENV